MESPFLSVGVLTRMIRFECWPRMFRLALSALILSVGITTTAIADVTDFTWTPTPICVGQIAIYTAVDNGTKNITSCKWEYQYDGGILCTSG